MATHTLFFPFIVGIELEEWIHCCISSSWGNLFTFSSFPLRKKINTEGDVPPSMSGSCAVCVDRVLYLFGGHHSRGNTNKVSVCKDGLRQFCSFSDHFRFLRLTQFIPVQVQKRVLDCDMFFAATYSLINKML